MPHWASEEMNISFEGSLIEGGEVDLLGNRLKTETDSMNRAAQRGYEDERASINLPIDDHQEVRRVVEEKRELDPEYLVVVGLGGSNLGTVAVQEAVLGRLYNQVTEKTKILYADTVDSGLLQYITALLESVLRRGGNVIINGVSKSGGTTETVANFQILVELLKRYKKDHHDFVVVTTDTGSRFWKFAKGEGYEVLEMPRLVGGRYSVFSPVGLFPLGLLGIDTDRLLSGAREMRDRCLQMEVGENPAALSAAHIFLHSRRGRNIYNLFLFSPDLESLGKWYRQLMGESIGKRCSREREAVFEGITPTVAIGSTDLHSMAQLYLGGPQDKYTTFVGVDEPTAEVRLPEVETYSSLVEGIRGRSLKEIMDAILQGVKVAYVKGKRPFSEITLPDMSERSIGQILQYKMMEMMYLGFLLDVNPFDQPNVEEYKVETRRILEGYK